MMKRQTILIFYVLGLYAVIQFAWWGYHLIELTEELKREPTEINKRVVMIIGEGLVFFAILMVGLWRIRVSFKKELQLSQRQTNFLLSVTHELKTPLAANKLYLQTLQKHDLIEEKRNDLLKKAEFENQRLELLIDNILNASRLENNALKPAKEKTNLSAFIHQLIERTRKRNPTVQIVEKVPTEISVNTDLFFIETIFNNLIENAIKYAGNQYPIEVELEKTERKVKLSVKDNGPGIPEEDRPYLFQKFFRVGNEETRKQKGSGLGLYIVAELVKAHGGTISFKENEPFGVIFEVTLTHD
jgi:two-component system, OmpR family, phosphate regulon sensor histidine kinase PhoR